MDNKKEHTFTERLLAVVFVFIFIPLGLFFIFFSSGDSSSKQYVPDQVDLHIQAQGFVKQALKSPSTAEFPVLPYETLDLGEGRYFIDSYVDSQNSFGAMIRSEWSVVMKLVGEKWFLEKLIVNNKIMYDTDSNNTN